jgi:hypothetical protein
VCLGQEFALMEVAYTVVKLLQTFTTIKMMGKMGFNTSHLRGVSLPWRPCNGLFVFLRVHETCYEAQGERKSGITDSIFLQKVFAFLLFLSLV